MNTTYNPQAGAEQARLYRDAVTPNTPVPEAMRAMAEKVVGIGVAKPMTVPRTRSTPQL